MVSARPVTTASAASSSAVRSGSAWSVLPQMAQRSPGFSTGHLRGIAPCHVAALDGLRREPQQILAGIDAPAATRAAISMCRCHAVGT